MVPPQGLVLRPERGPFVAVVGPSVALAARLRGREEPDAVRARLGRSGYAAPAGDVATVDNGGPLERGVRAFLAALPAQPVSP